MTKYFNRASSLRGLREVAEEAGADLSAAMRAHNLKPDVLRRPEERIDYERVCALFEQCADDWNMPDLGLRLAPFQHLEILGPVGLVTKMARDLRGALRAIAENLVIHSNAIVAAIDEQDDVATIALEPQPVPSGTRQYALLATGVTRNVMEQAGAAPVELYEVTLRNEDSGEGAAARSFFRCPIRFGSERNALHFSRDALKRPIHNSDPAYHAIIQKYLSTTRHEVAGQTHDEVRQEISRQMEFGGGTLESVARSLRTEPRSLQRRLKQEGHSFRELMDEWRRKRALELITNTRLPLSEVSLAVGYSDQSIFSRAFQRWYGETPLAFRNTPTALIGRD